MVTPIHSDAAHTDATAWFQRSQALIRHALSGRVDRAEDVDDLAQEVYLRLLRVPRWDLVRNPQAYLYRVAVNVAQEWRLKAQQSNYHSDELLEELRAQDDPEQAAGQTERDQATRRSLEALPVAWRTAVTLHVAEGLTLERVAERMDITRRTAKRYLANGYAALRDELMELRAGDQSLRGQNDGE